MQNKRNSNYYVQGEKKDNNECVIQLLPEATEFRYSFSEKKKLQKHQKHHHHHQIAMAIVSFPSSYLCFLNHMNLENACADETKIHSDEEHNFYLKVM